MEVVLSITNCILVDKTITGTKLMESTVFTIIQRIFIRPIPIQDLQ